MSDMKTAAGRRTANRFNDYPHFRQLWLQVVMALLAVAIIPLVVLSRGMSAYGESMLRKNIVQSLKTAVVSHKEAIDSFLEERTQDLALILENSPGQRLADAGALEKVFNALQRQRPCFQDLGVLDGRGRHLAYVGPFQLGTRNYAGADWFKAVMDQGVYISDVFMGFRLEPHFVMAVRHGRGADLRILRATMDARYFRERVSGAGGPDGADAFLIDRAGRYQTRPQTGGRLMAPSGIDAGEAFEGVRSETAGKMIRLTAWQTRVPWLCVVQIRILNAFAPLAKARTVMSYALGLSAVLILLTVVLTTNRLVAMLEQKRLNIGRLDRQLRRSSFLAAAMELSQGFFSECRDIQSNIDASLTWMGDGAEGDGCGGKWAEGVAEVRSENARARQALDNLIAFIRPAEALVTEVELNGLMDELVAVLSGPLRRRRIRIRRDPERIDVTVRSDRAKLGQVFLNLMQNAMDAVDADGCIALSVNGSSTGAAVTLVDTGPGIDPKTAQRIFEPLFTTKRDGTGLGLSICRDIMDELGGSVAVDTRSGPGGTFTVTMPLVMPAAEGTTGA
jgi:two-component system, NtrC family, sensor kinase